MTANAGKRHSPLESPDRPCGSSVFPCTRSHRKMQSVVGRHARFVVGSTRFRDSKKQSVVITGYNQASLYSPDFLRRLLAST